MSCVCVGGGGMYTYGVKHVNVVLSAQLCVCVWGGGGVHIRCEACICGVELGGGGGTCTHTVSSMYIWC